MKSNVAWSVASIIYYLALLGDEDLNANNQGITILMAVLEYDC